MWLLWEFLTDLKMWTKTYFLYQQNVWHFVYYAGDHRDTCLTFEDVFFSMNLVSAWTFCKV